MYRILLLQRTERI